MSEDSHICIIPRNLNKSDLIINTPIKLDWKQFGYLIGGALAGTFIYTSQLPFALKTSCIVTTSLISLIGSFYRYEGSTMDEILLNSVTYAGSKKVYEKHREGGCVVKINTRKNEKQDAFSIKQLITVQNT